MAQNNFGMILRDARERQGIDLNTAARRLRIRPDIIRAIEASDFSHMPPRGYARNMVNAYARFLGLNSTEITRMYLDDCYAYQVGRARTNTRSTGFDMSEADSGRKSKGQAKKQQQRHEAVQRGGAFGRDLYVDDPNRDRRNIQAEREHLYGQGRMHRSEASSLGDTRYTNFYSGPKAPSAVRSRLPFVVAGIIILVLLIIVLVLLFGPGRNSGDDPVPNVPVSGLNDPTNSGTTTNGDTNATDQQPIVQTPVAPTKTVVTYKVDTGTSVWIDITQDGVQVLGEVVNGPAEQSYDVTGTLVFRAGFSTGVSLFQDGTAIPLADHSSSGAPVVTIDFNEVLAQWQIDNAQQSSGNANTAGTNTGSGATQ